MKKQIIIIMVFYFILTILNNIGHPVTPAFVRDLNIPEVFFGIFFATMSFGMMLAAPIWGGFGDQGKRKLSIILGTIIYAVGQLGFVFSNNQYLMILFRLIAGLGIAAPMTLFIAMVISYSKEKRVRNLAILSALSILGPAIGYQIGGLLGDSEGLKTILPSNSFENVFIVQAILMVLFALMVFLFVKELKTNNGVISKRNPFKSLAKIKTLDYKLILFLISLSLITMGSTNIAKYLDVYFNDLGHSTTSLGNVVLVTGIVSVVTSIFIVPIVSKFKKQLSFIIVIQFLSAIIIFFVFRASNFMLAIYSFYNVYNMFKAIYLPLEQNYIAKSADDDSIGTITGIRQSFVSIGNVIGPLLGGLIYSIKPLRLFDSSGILFILGGIILLFVLRRDNKSVQEELVYES